VCNCIPNIEFVIDFLLHWNGTEFCESTCVLQVVQTRLLEYWHISTPNVSDVSMYVCMYVCMCVCIYL